MRGRMYVYVLSEISLAVRDTCVRCLDRCRLDEKWGERSLSLFRDYLNLHRLIWTIVRQQQHCYTGVIMFHQQLWPPMRQYLILWFLSMILILWNSFLDKVSTLTTTTNSPLTSIISNGRDRILIQPILMKCPHKIFRVNKNSRGVEQKFSTPRTRSNLVPILILAPQPHWHTSNSPCLIQDICQTWNFNPKDSMPINYHQHYFPHKP